MNKAMQAKVDSATFTKFITPFHLKLTRGNVTLDVASKQSLDYAWRISHNGVTLDVVKGRVPARDRAVELLETISKEQPLMNKATQAKLTVAIPLELAETLASAIVSPGFTSKRCEALEALHVAMKPAREAKVTIEKEKG